MYRNYPTVELGIGRVEEREELLSYSSYGVINSN
jgi:hypothetical protein